jgi:hypothetical protein
MRHADPELLILTAILQFHKLGYINSLSFLNPAGALYEKMLLGRRFWREPRRFRAVGSLATREARLGSIRDIGRLHPSLRRCVELGSIEITDVRRDENRKQQTGNSVFKLRQL